MAALPVSETHRIELAAGSRVVSTSDGLGWANIHASVTSERRWAGSLTPIEHICFAYCLRRSARIERRIAGETAVRVLSLHPRQFGILPTRVASSFRLTGAADIMMVYLRGSLVERVAREQLNKGAGSDGIQPKVGFFDPLLEQVAMELVAALDRRNMADDPPYIDQLATTAAAHLIRHHAERQEGAPNGAALRARPASQAILARLQHHIEENLGDDLSLGRLAQDAGLSQGRLVALFGTAKGETPHQYVLRRRVERAKTLLIATSFSIADIALQTGFSSQSHLSDIFKRMTGETPGAFRNADIVRSRG